MTEIFSIRHGTEKEKIVYVAGKILIRGSVLFTPQQRIKMNRSRILFTCCIHYCGVLINQHNITISLIIQKLIFEYLWKCVVRIIKRMENINISGLNFKTICSRTRKSMEPSTPGDGCKYKLFQKRPPGLQL